MRSVESDFHPHYAALADKLESLIHSARSPQAEAWLRSKKALCEEKAGKIPAAIRDMDKALRIHPCDEYHAQRGHLLLHRKQYSKSVLDFSRAIQLTDKLEYRIQRAQAYWLSGKIKKARADFRHCASVNPDSMEYAFRAALFDILTGSGHSARSLAKRWKRSSDNQRRSCAEFLKGVAKFRAKEFSKARHFFHQVESIAGPSNFPAMFFRLPFTVLSSALDFMRKKYPRRRMKRTGAVVLAGLGLEYPRQASLEVLEELTHCDTVFSNLAGAEAMFFLSLFNSNIRTVSYEGLGGEKEIARRIIGEALRGRRVAFVTRGHPLISGTLAQVILASARRKNLPVISYGSVSTIDSVLAISQSNLFQVHPGLQAYDARLLTPRKVTINRELPLLLSLALKNRGPRDLVERLPKWIEELCKEISRNYSAEHEIFIYGPRYDAKQMEAVRVSALKRRLLQIKPAMIASVMIYISPEGRPLKVN